MAPVLPQPVCPCPLCTPLISSRHSIPVAFCWSVYTVRGEEASQCYTVMILLLYRTCPDADNLPGHSLSWLRFSLQRMVSNCQTRLGGLECPGTADTTGHPAARQHDR